MKITYTSPNRSHHYPYAEALHKMGHLHAFVSGVSRLSPRAGLHSLGDTLKRHDFFQTLFLASLEVRAPVSVTNALNQISSKRLDQASYSWARESDFFIFYQAKGLSSTQRLHREKRPTICIMEEVNSHIQNAESLLRNEWKRLDLGQSFVRDHEYDARLRTYEEADYILCPSDFVRDSFVTRGFAPERLLKVNYGFPAMKSVVDSVEKSGNERFRMLYVGQLHYRKGLHYAVEAFRKLKHPKKEFVIVGGETQVTGLEKTQLPDGVIFTGVLKGEELREQYLQADVFVLPSLEEGFGLVVAEALGHGLPVVITTNTGAGDVITDKVEGFVVPPFDATGLQNRIQQLIDDPGLRKQMGQAALKTAASLGSWGRSAGQLISELQSILGKQVAAVYS